MTVSLQNESQSTGLGSGTGPQLCCQAVADVGGALAPHRRRSERLTSRASLEYPAKVLMSPICEGIAPMIGTATNLGLSPQACLPRLAWIGVFLPSAVHSSGTRLTDVSAQKKLRKIEPIVARKPRSFSQRINN
jgi:hypothetical protein